MFEQYYVNVRLRTVERHRNGLPRKMLRASHASMMRLARWARRNRRRVQVFTPYSFGWSIEVVDL